MPSDSKTPEPIDDRYRDLDGLAAYSGMSTRTLRRHIADPDHPLPNHYVRPAGKGRGRIMVSKRAFDRWVEAFPPVGQVERKPPTALAAATAADIVASIRRSQR